MNVITRNVVCVALGFALFVVPLLGGWGSATFHAGVPVLSLDWLIPGWIAWLVIVPTVFAWLHRKRDAIKRGVDDIGRALDTILPCDCAKCGRALPSGANFCINCQARVVREHPHAVTGRTERL